MSTLLSIVIPCYNEGKSVALSYEQTCKTLQDISSRVDAELIYIDDGSKDDTIDRIQGFMEKDPRISLIVFSRNFGKEAALLAGLVHAKGDAVVIMDADLQDPPSLIPEMLQYWQDGYDIVSTRRTDRSGEPPIRSWFAKRFYSLINKMCEIRIPDGVRDFRLMDKKVVEAVLQMKERLRFSKGLFAWVGYREKCIDYPNVHRAEGKSGWSFLKLFNYAIEGIVSFTYFPLRLASLAGLLIALAAFGFMSYIVLDKLINGNPVSGYPSLVSLVTFIGGVQLIFLGIIGEYLGRIFYEVKGRPHYIIRQYMSPRLSEGIKPTLHRQ